jgi:hypothetical protein
MIRRLASNALANVTNGATNALFQLGMTAVLARGGSSGDLPTWSLAASVAGFAPLLSCNLSTAVARRMVATAAEAADRRVPILATARRIASALALLCLALALVIGVALPLLYPSVAAGRPLGLGVVGACLFLGSCWVVASQPEQGWHLWTQHNWTITAAGLAARGFALVATAVLLWGAGWPMWAAVAAASVAMWAGVLVVRRGVPTSTSAMARADEHAKLAATLRGFAVWNLTSAAIQAATVPFVTWLLPAMAAPFYMAFTLVTLVIGTAAAAANALVSPLGRLLHVGQKRDASHVSVRASLVLTAGIQGAFVTIYLAMPLLLPAWVGRGTVSTAAVSQALCLLALQHGLRSTALVPSIMLAMALPPQRLVRAPLMEALLVAVAALPLAALFGWSGFMLGLALAGALGAASVGWQAVRDVLGGDDRSVWGTLVASQIAIAALWLLLWQRGIPS